jgi:subtilisin
MTPVTRLVMVVAVALPLLFLSGAGASGQEIPGQFIVELKPGVDRDAFTALHGIAPIFVYDIVHGFAARLPAPLLQRLQADARVAAITQDLVVTAFERPTSRGPVSSSATSAKETFTPEAQTGVRRIGANVAAENGFQGAGVKVAVIDTGIDCTHPDLQPNCVYGINYVSRGKPPKDNNGHGTHVAGIIAAAGSNGFGLQGVAPKASVYAVKVLDANGSGSLSTVIKGLNWAASNHIQVSNLSLGAFDFSLGSNAMCNAVANAVAGGMTVVVAAGNSMDEALFYTPANCRSSLTVSALADSDGLAGSLGAPLSDGDQDDSFASFSNYSNYCYDVNGDGMCTGVDKYVVDIMAPGVDIMSTLPTYPVTLNGAPYNKSLYYDTLSGTSMATPHVAGAAALLIGAGVASNAEQVKSALRRHGECGVGASFNGVLGMCTAPWTNDPDLVWEPLLSVGSLVAPWP